MSSDAPERVLSDADIRLVEHLAEGQSLQEICDYFYMRYEDLLPADKVEVDQAFKKGRVNIRDYALRKLKEACQGKSGMQASLAILSQFGTEWDKADQVAGVKSFKVLLD